MKKSVLAIIFLLFHKIYTQRTIFNSSHTIYILVLRYQFLMQLIKLVVFHNVCFHRCCKIERGKIVLGILSVTKKR